jgi:hypothetical protein
MKRFLRWCAVFVVIIVAGSALVAWAYGYLPVRMFDSALWKGGEDEGVRLSMIDAMLLTHELRGLSRGEVDALLGPPTDTDYFSSWDLVYWLGPERGFLGIDSEWLVIRFGKDDRVFEWAVVRD